MKRTILASVVLLFLGVAARAQNTPTVDKREHKQRVRVHEGIASGEVTRREAANLRAEQRSIRRTERRAKADGTVTRRERANLHRKQNKANRDIRRQKHDMQERS